MGVMWQRFACGGGGGGGEAAAKYQRLHTIYLVQYLLAADAVSEVHVEATAGARDGRPPDEVGGHHIILPLNAPKLEKTEGLMDPHVIV